MKDDYLLDTVTTSTMVTTKKLRIGDITDSYSLDTTKFLNSLSELGLAVHGLLVDMKVDKLTHITIDADYVGVPSETEE